MKTEGASEYTDLAGLLNESSSQFPETALFQIIANKVSGSKLLIGKPTESQYCTNGYMDPSLLADCLKDAKNRGWGKLMYSFDEQILIPL